MISGTAVAGAALAATIFVVAMRLAWGSRNRFPVEGRVSQLLFYLYLYGSYFLLTS
jgi:hypothetical protein